MAAPWLLRNMNARDYMDVPARRRIDGGECEGDDAELEMTDLEVSSPARVL